MTMGQEYCTLIDNVTIIKDLCTTAFAGVAIYLAILTYNRAKATILQPVRTEVIKKQSGILSDLLAAIAQDEIISFDYVDIVSVNACSILLRYGFYFSNQEELEKEVAAKSFGVVHCGEDNILRHFTLYQPFDSEQTAQERKKENFEQRKQEYEKAKKEGVIVVDTIIITPKHAQFLNKLRDFKANPFMPSNIQEKLKDLFHEININLKVHLKQTLEEFTAEFFKRDASSDSLSFSSLGLWNDFNHRRFPHREQFDEIKKAIREHLRIDERWY